MKAKIFIFDIDETLLCVSEKVESHLNQVPVEISRFNPYPRRGYDYTCITLNREKMKDLIHEIVEKGCLIGFITKGTLSAEDMSNFFRLEFDVRLKEGFPFYNRKSIKTRTLAHIAKQYRVDRKEIVLIDNAIRHTAPAEQAGFSIVHVDTNPSDQTHGTCYLEQLKNMIPKEPIGKIIFDETVSSDSEERGHYDFYASFYDYPEEKDNNFHSRMCSII